jgi:hypothetical protein
MGLPSIGVESATVVNLGLGRVFVLQGSMRAVAVVVIPEIDQLVFKIEASQNIVVSKYLVDNADQPFTNGWDSGT